MLGLGSAARRRRYREVVTVLRRHGVGVAANWTGVRRLIPFHRRLVRRAERDAPNSSAEHLRLALEELGTTAIKVGQILSTRADLVPGEIAVELAKLRDNVPPVPAPLLVATIEQACGCPLSEMFSTFNHEPLAAASIGQVHRATLQDGTEVVVKVRKPGVVETVTEDLSILRDLARLFSDFEGLGGIDLIAIVDELSRTLRGELDYVREGRNADRIRSTLSDDGPVIVPRVHWEYTSEAVLVMDFIEGQRLQEAIEGRDTAALKQLAGDTAAAFMRQIFETGFFHADPHQGNIIVRNDGKIALLDFGMTGALDEDLRLYLTECLAALVSQDASGLTNAFEDLGILSEPSKRGAVKRDIRVVLDQYHGLDTENLDVSSFIQDLFGIARRHRLSIPPDVVLVLKTITMIDGVCRELDPQFNVTLIAEPFVREAIRRRYAPRQMSRRIAVATRDALDASLRLPAQVSRLTARLERGEIEFKLRHEGMEWPIENLRLMVARLSTAMVVSALIVGLAIIGASEHPPFWDIIAPAWFVMGMVAIAGLTAGQFVFGRRKPRQ